MMISYRAEAATLHVTPHFSAGSWCHVTNPTHEELALISQNARIPADVLADSLDVDERARCDYDEGFVFIIVRIPVVDHAEHHAHFFTVPLGIIITTNVIITICRKENELMEEFTRHHIKAFNPANHSRFLLQIFLRTALVYLRDLKAINSNSAVVQEKLHKSMVNKHLIGLLVLEKSLVFFTTSLRSNELMLERLQKLPSIKFSEDDQDLFDDVMVEMRQAIEMSNIYSNILTGMMDAFASIISNNLNVTMKRLATINVIFMPMAVLTGIGGMSEFTMMTNHVAWWKAYLFFTLALAVVGYITYLILAMINRRSSV
jgi:magnesium transporter